MDLGFNQDETALLQVRTNLMSDRLYIGKRKLSQAQAANN